MAHPSGPDSPSVEQRVERALRIIRPALQADGGDVELVRVDADGVVELRLHGACAGCPSASQTLRAGIERNLRAHIPEITGVRAVL